MSSSGRPKRDPESPSTPPTPTEARFLAARAEWDGRFGDLARGKRNWQIAALLSTLLALVLAGGSMALALRSRVQTVIVREAANGELDYRGPVEVLQDLAHRNYVAELARFIRSARSVSSDPDAQKHWVDQAYAFTTEAAAGILNGYYAEHNPYELGNDVTVAVTVRTVAPVAGSDSTWQIRWTEDRRHPGGRVFESHDWQALVTTKVIPPRTIEAALLNPGGLYLTHLHWTPEIGSDE